MQPNWTVHMEITGGPEHMKDQWPRIKEDALDKLGEFWHEEYYPLHFKSFAPGKYGYEPRTYDYRQRKRRKHGHDQPLVFSGSFKRDTTSWAEIVTTQNKATVKMRASVLNLVNRAINDPNYPNIKEEATAVAPGEEQRFAQWLDDKASEALNNIDTTITTT